MRQSTAVASPVRSGRSSRPLRGGLDIVVVANRSQQSAGASFVDAKPGLRTQLLVAPPEEVVLHRAREPVIGDGALLPTDAAGADLRREVREQLRCTSVAGMGTDRTAVVAIRREGRDDSISITSVHRRQVAVDDLRRTRIGRWKDRRPNVMS